MKKILTLLFFAFYISAFSQQSPTVTINGSSAAVQNVLDPATPTNTTLAGIRGNVNVFPTTKTLYTTNIGQQGNWVYDPTDNTSADNTGTILVDGANRRWKRVFSGKQNILWYGVVGDSITDNSANITSMFNYFGTITTGIDLYVPPGVYRNDSANLPKLQNVTISGVYSKSRFYSNSKTTLFYAQGDWDNVIWDGIAFASYAVQTHIDYGNALIYFFQHRWINSHIQRCYFTSPNSNSGGLSCLVQWPSTGAKIGAINGFYVEESTFINIGQAAIGVGSRLLSTRDSAQKIYINKNRFINLGLNSTDYNPSTRQGQYGFAVTADGRGVTGSFNFNYLENCFDIGFEDTGYDDWEVAGNKFRSGTGDRLWSPIAIDPGSQTGIFVSNVRVHDNTCIDSLGSGLVVIRANNCIFENNVWKAQTASQNHLVRNSRNCTFKDETFQTQGIYALNLESTTSVIGGNTYTDSCFNNKFYNILADNSNIFAGSSNIATIACSNTNTFGNSFDNSASIKPATGGYTAQQAGAHDNYFRRHRTANVDLSFTRLSINMSDADYTFSSDQDDILYDYYVFTSTAGLTATRAVTFVNKARTFSIIRNATTQTLNLTFGSSVLSVYSGQVIFVTCDGTNLGSIGAVFGNAYNTNIFRLGPWGFWMNQGTLWFKNGTPSSATDGTPVAILSHTDISTGSGGTVNLPSSVRGTQLVNFNPASVLATFTLNFPATPFDGDVVILTGGGSLAVGAKVVASLTLTFPTGTAYPMPGPFTLYGSDFLYFVWNASTSTWRLNSNTSSPHIIFTPTTGTTVTIVDNTTNIINPSGTLATLTLAIPVSGNNNDRITIKTTQTITTPTISGGTWVGAPTTFPAGFQTTINYDAATSSWY